MLIDTIKKENMLALKEHNENKRAVLSVVINKYMVMGYEYKANNKEMTDTECLTCINKTLKELEEELESYKKANRTDSIKEIEEQINTIKGYLPAQMSEEEIRSIILKLDDKSVPSVMKHFNMNYKGKCDMGLVNKVLREVSGK